MNRNTTMDGSTMTVLKVNVPQIPYYHEVYGAILRNIQRLLFYSIHLTLSCMHYSFVLLQSIVSYKLSLPLHKLQASQIIDDAKQLIKSPKHVVVIINEDGINLINVVDIIVWSVFSGIPYITVCDRKGFLLQNYSVLQQKYEAKVEEMCSEKIFYPSTQFHFHKFAEKQTNTPHNVIITSTSSSRQNLIECVKSLSIEMTNNSILKQNFNAKMVDEKSKELTGSVIDPDLAITFGPYLSYFGYQPWNVRLTEFISLSSIGNLSYRKFMQVLQRFAGCEQRFGA